jgi:hypothetical protein
MINISNTLPHNKYKITCPKCKKVTRTLDILNLLDDIEIEESSSKSRPTKESINHQEEPFESAKNYKIS